MTVVNLNKFRKQKARADKAKQAEHNRKQHGRTKLERASDANAEANRQKLLHDLEQKKLDPK